MNKEQFSSGDVVKSVAGRDKDKIFIIIRTQEKSVFLVDGRTRKINNPKKKSAKHLEMISVAKGFDLAIKIQQGEPIANKKVYRIINAKKEKIQED